MDKMTIYVGLPSFGGQNSEHMRSNNKSALLGDLGDAPAEFFSNKCWEMYFNTVWKQFQTSDCYDNTCIRMKDPEIIILTWFSSAN